MKYDRERSLQLLRKGTENPKAEFRDGQEEAIRHVLEGLGKLLVVQKTGWGQEFRILHSDQAAARGRSRAFSTDIPVALAHAESNSGR